MSVSSLGHIHYTDIVCQILNKVCSAISAVLLVCPAMYVYYHQWKFMFQQRLGLCALGNVCLGYLHSGHFSSNSMTVGGHPLIESCLVFSSFMETDWNKMFKGLPFSFSSSFFFFFLSFCLSVPCFKRLYLGSLLCDKSAVNVYAFCFIWATPVP